MRQSGRASRFGDVGQRLHSPSDTDGCSLERASRQSGSTALLAEQKCRYRAGLRRGSWERYVRPWFAGSVHRDNRSGGFYKAVSHCLRCDDLDVVGEAGESRHGGSSVLEGERERPPAGLVDGRVLDQGSHLVSEDLGHRADCIWRGSDEDVKPGTTPLELRCPSLPERHQIERRSIEAARGASVAVWIRATRRTKGSRLPTTTAYQRPALFTRPRTPSPRCCLSL